MYLMPGEMHNYFIPNAVSKNHDYGILLILLFKGLILKKGKKYLTFIGRLRILKFDLFKIAKRISESTKHPFLIIGM